MRMWLVTTNDRKLVPAVFDLSGFSTEELTAQADLAYGAAVFAAEGEVLSLKRPISRGMRLDRLITEELRTTRVLAQATEVGGSFVPENVPPFRHKGWVCSLVGDLPPGVDIDGLDDEHERDLLSRNVRGTSSREQVANLILARMVSSGLAKRREVNAELCRSVVSRTVSPMVGKEGFEKFVVVLTSASWGLVWGHGIPVSYRTVSGARRRRWGAPQRSAKAHLRATMVVGGLSMEGDEWQVLEDKASLLVGDLPPARVLGGEAPPFGGR